MKKVYEVQLTRIVTEYRVVQVEADNSEDARKRARKLSHEEAEPSSREYTTDWCDSKISNHHRIISVEEKL